MKPAPAQTRTIWINARFLSRPVSGVERVARELLAAVADRLDEDGAWTTPEGRRLSFRLIAPASSKAESPWPKLRLHRAGLGGGHTWEQTSLLVATRGDWLVSLCNTGPMLKRRHILFLHDAHVALHQALPLLVDWTATIGLTASGALLEWSTDEEPPWVRPVTDRRFMRIALAQGALKYPGIAPLVPVRPAEAIDCPWCRGPGRGPRRKDRDQSRCQNR